jgi:hypothetical protein
MREAVSDFRDVAPLDAGITGADGYARLEALV